MRAVVPASLLARLNPIEEAFSKIKGALRKAKARGLDALFEATREALRSVTEEDALAVSSRSVGTSSHRSTLYENCFRVGAPALSV